MASALFSSIQSLSTKLLEAIRGTPSTSHQQDPPSPVSEQQKSVRKDLEKLSRMLARIQAFQQDAEEREIHDCSVRLWLAELRGVAYQAEDLLDEFYYEVLRSIVESGDAAIEAYHRDGGAKRKFGEMYTSSSLASKVSIPDGMVEKIKSITERFEEISNARRDLHLREEDGTRLVMGPQIRPPTSSHLDERATFGREEEKEEIISILDHSDGPDFMVLPIVGMGGFGKTTLAQLVFNDSRIHGLFNKRCWVSVSEDFDPVRLTKAIVESVNDNPCEFYELNKLQDILKEKISGHGLFLVLDDVWNEQRNLWECFRVGFLGAKFVRILTTTRNTSVAMIMQTTSPFQLSSLPKENCWSLFKHFAFGNRETSENTNLHEIGRGIVKKCKGSPLAIKALGGILRYYEMDEEKWREILDSDISEIDEKGEVMPALRLSYQKLPQHLKPCFLYLSMFPKDFYLEKDMVIRLWMAQGYINGNTRNLKTLEEIGSEYFDELQGRSLVDDGPQGYILHDLIHDLARSVSQEAYSPVLENDQEYNGVCKVCHLCFTKQDELLGLVPSNYRSIRTFVEECWSEKFDFPIFSEISCVRALQLRYSSLPNTFGTLKHLRYLFVESTEMLLLPETLCLLYNLQTLVLDCDNLKELPRNIKNLINLQCFKLESRKIHHLPESIFPLPNLQTLSLNCEYLIELPENMKNLINLRYFKLKSSEIQHLPESIFSLPNLQTLSLRFCDNLEELPRGIEKSTRLHILHLPTSVTNMPSGIGKLPTLQQLWGHFSVMGHGINGGLRILKDMNKLRGLLCISGLRNIVDVELCRNANLASKPNLQELILNFQEDCGMEYFRDEELHLHLTDHSRNNAKSENDEKMHNVVLENLQPHGNLTKLTILNYGGQNFPSWLLYSLLPKLTTLILNFCTEPNIIPPFGQLSHLRFLEISNSTCVRNLGDEPRTYSSYPSLEKLSLRNLLNLVEWQANDGDFPCLEKLVLENCPELWKIPTIPQNVSNVTFENCPKLKFLTCPSVIRNLNIMRCGFREIMLHSVSSNLTISNCVELISINWIGGLNSYVNVSFEYCPKLELHLPGNGVLHSTTLHLGKRSVYQIDTTIKELNLPRNNKIYLTDSRIPLLESQLTLFFTKEDFREVGSLTCAPSIGVSCQHVILNLASLVILEIMRCKNIISVTGLDNLSNLKCLSISLCPELCNWNDKTLPLSLKFLELNHCDKLSSLPLLSVQNHSSTLEVLVITMCPRLDELVDFQGLVRLKTVDIRHCRNISISLATESLPRPRINIGDCPLMRDWCQRNNITYNEFIGNPQEDREGELESAEHGGGEHESGEEEFGEQESAEIYDCPRLSLGERYVYQRDTTIKEFNLSGNNKIHLSDTTIPLLENQFKIFLTKEDFPEVESLTCAPSVGVSCQHVILNLASLVILEIMRCTKVISVTGLDNLSNLKCLRISFCPELCNWNDKTLPLSLKFLELNYCDKLSSLPLLPVQNHSSTLEVLVITMCPRLDELVDFQGLMKLKTVDIRHCRNISISLATESLPRPRINIGDCPLMRDWCQRNNITYDKLYPPIGNPQDDREAEQERAEST